MKNTNKNPFLNPTFKRIVQIGYKFNKKTGKQKAYKLDKPLLID